MIQVTFDRFDVKSVSPNLHNFCTTQLYICISNCLWLFKNNLWFKLTHTNQVNFGLFVLSLQWSSFTYLLSWDNLNKQKLRFFFHFSFALFGLIFNSDCTHITGMLSYTGSVWKRQMIKLCALFFSLNRFSVRFFYDFVISFIFSWLFWGNFAISRSIFQKHFSKAFFKRWFGHFLNDFFKISIDIILDVFCTKKFVTFLKYYWLWFC